MSRDPHFFDGRAPHRHRQQQHSSSSRRHDTDRGSRHRCPPFAGRRGPGASMARASFGDPGGHRNPNPNSNQPMPHATGPFNSGSRHCCLPIQNGRRHRPDTAALHHRDRYCCYPRSRRYYNDVDFYDFEGDNFPLAQDFFYTRPRAQFLTSLFDDADFEYEEAPPRRPAPTAQFAELSRIFFKIIKLCHHLNNFSPTDSDKKPAVVSQMVQYLCTAIKPALPDSDILTLLKNNAHQWGLATVQALKQHYSDALSDLLMDIGPRLPRDWSSPFQVATRWAKRNFFRLSQPTLDRARELIHSQATDASTQVATDTSASFLPPAVIGGPTSPTEDAPLDPPDSFQPEPAPSVLSHPFSHQITVPPTLDSGQHSLSSRASKPIRRSPPPPQRQALSTVDTNTPRDALSPRLLLPTPKLIAHGKSDVRQIHPTSSQDHLVTDSDDYIFQTDEDSYDDKTFLDSSDEDQPPPVKNKPQLDIKLTKHFHSTLIKNTTGESLKGVTLSKKSHKHRKGRKKSH